MIPLSVSEIEGEYPERDEGTENGAGLVLKNSSTSIVGYKNFPKL